MTVSMADYLFLFSLVIIWAVLLYHTLLSYAGYRFFLTAARQQCVFDELPAVDLPTVTVLIPAHNEEAVIEKTLEAMGNLDYPHDRIEILCLNDNSRDWTGYRARKCAAGIGSRIRVIDVPPERGGRGKSAVLNFGLERAGGDVIAVYDADNTPEREALQYLVRTLLQGEERLGAVIGKFRTRNRMRNLLTRFINLETIFFQWTTQAGRRALYGLATIPGTNFVIWKDLVIKLGGWDEKALTEDTELSIRIYLEGFEIGIAPFAVTWEEEPDRLRVWFRQRTRWAMGNLYVIGKFLFPLARDGEWRLFFDIFYLVGIYFFFLASLVISLSLFVLGIAGFVHISVEGPFGVLWLLAIALFLLEMGICLTYEPGEDNIGNLGLALLMYFTYSQMWLLVILKSFVKSLENRFRPAKTFWQKTERTG